jgi:ligand-binding SRPBCC domain-containing protein
VSLIHLVTLIDAPIERCFDLARSVDAHLASTSATAERVIAGKAHGLLELDDEVTWEAKHLGIRQRLTAKIVAFDRPRHFRDRMVRGAFARFDHDHTFEEIDRGTRMIDDFDFDAPLGMFGMLADAIFLRRYMTRFLVARALELKRLAEREDKGDAD